MPAHNLPRRLYTLKNPSPHHNSLYRAEGLQNMQLREERQLRRSPERNCTDCQPPTLRKMLLEPL
jgi:hypothetical protein